MTNFSEKKDIKYIEVQFMSSTNKKTIKINLVDTITRQDAREIMELINTGGGDSIFSVKGYTTNNAFIFV